MFEIFDRYIKNVILVSLYYYQLVLSSSNESILIYSLTGGIYHKGVNESNIIESFEHNEKNLLLRNHLTNDFDYIYSKNILLWISSNKDFYVTTTKNNNYNDGNNMVTKLLTETSYHITSIAVDWVHNLVYFNHINIIYVMAFNKPRLRYIVSRDGDFNSDLAVNPIESFLIWSKPSEILKARQDGSQTVVLAKHDVKPRSLVIDYVLQRIYYVDVLYSYLWSVDYNGSDHKLLLKYEKLALSSHSLDIFGNYIFWSQNNILFRTSKKEQDNNNIEWILTAKYNINSFKLVYNTRQPIVFNRCDQTKCSHICLPIGTDDYRCVCPLSEYLLSGDRCDEATIKDKADIILSLDNSISITSLKSFDENPIVEKTEPLYQIDYWTSSIEYGITNNLLFWTKLENKNGTLETLVYMAPLMQNRNTTFGITGPKVLFENTFGSTGCIAYDWIHELMYYNTHEAIFVLNINNPSVRYIIAENRYSIKKLAINPLQSFIIWSENNETLDSDFIIKATQDGSQEDVLIDRNIMNTEALTIDFIAETILWIDNIFYTLTSISFDGNNRKIIYQSKQLFENAFSLDTFGGYIYFNNYFTKSVLKVDVNGNDVSMLESGEGIDFESNNRVNALKVLHSNRQPNTTNKCYANKCSHLCLPVDSKYYRCVCPINDVYKFPIRQNCIQSKNLVIRQNEEFLKPVSSNFTLILIIGSLIVIFIIAVAIIIVTIITFRVRRKRKLKDEQIYQDINNMYQQNPYNEYDTSFEKYDEIDYEVVDTQYDDATTDHIDHRAYTEILPPLVIKRINESESNLHMDMKIIDSSYMHMKGGGDSKNYKINQI